MPSSEGFVQAYNAQAGVDIDSYLIVENHLTSKPMTSRRSSRPWTS